MANDSKAGEVGARYATALFDLAKEAGSIATVSADLKSLKTMLAESADLRTLVGSPVFDAEAKAKGLAAIAERAGFAPLTKKFLGLLAGQRRASSLRDVKGRMRPLFTQARVAASAGLFLDGLL